MKGTVRPGSTAGRLHDLTPEGRRRDAIAQHVAPSEDGEDLLKRGLHVVNRVWVGTYNDGFIHAGNLAYMAILSLFPFFITAATIFSAFGEVDDRAAAINAFLLAVPKVVADVIGPVARDVIDARSGWLLWIGAIFGVWTVSSLIETIRDILRRAYGTPPGASFLKQRLKSMGLTFGAVILLMTSLVAQLMLSATQEVVSAWFPQAADLLATLSLSRIITTVGLLLSLWLLFFALTPRRYRGRTYPKWPGAVLTAGWWLTVTALLPPVLGAVFAYDLTYGSLAGVMIALFFFWLVGLGLVIGAELNAALAITPEERGLADDGDYGDED